VYAPKPRAEHYPCRPNSPSAAVCRLRIRFCTERRSVNGGKIATSTVPVELRVLEASRRVSARRLWTERSRLHLQLLVANGACGHTVVHPSIKAWKALALQGIRDLTRPNPTSHPVLGRDQYLPERPATSVNACATVLVPAKGASSTPIGPFHEHGFEPRMICAEAASRFRSDVQSGDRIYPRRASPDVLGGSNGARVGAELRGHHDASVGSTIST
jgi:hypothetical protein